MRNITKLGLLAIVATALVAFVGTSVASATPTFTAEKAGNALSTALVKNHAFTVTGNKVECEKISFAGVTEGASYTSQTVTPTYDECKLGSLNANVIENNCMYTFKSHTNDTEGADSPDHATVKLHDCADATKGIQIEVSIPFFAKCLVDVPEQSIEDAVHYTNTTPEGKEMTVDVEVTASGIMVDVTTSTGLCPLTTGTHSGANGGTYTGTQSVTAAGGVTWSA